MIVTVRPAPALEGTFTGDRRLEAGFVGHALQVLPSPFLSQVFQQRVTKFDITKIVTRPEGA